MFKCLNCQGQTLDYKSRKLDQYGAYVFTLVCEDCDTEIYEADYCKEFENTRPNLEKVE